MPGSGICGGPGGRPWKDFLNLAYHQSELCGGKSFSKFIVGKREGRFLTARFSPKVNFNSFDPVK